MLSPNLKQSSHTTVRPRVVDVYSYRALNPLAFLSDRPDDGANSLSVRLKPFQQCSINISQFIIYNEPTRCNSGSIVFINLLKPNDIYIYIYICVCVCVCVCVVPER